ncbi:MAG TPA: polyamine ABC transporter substrate-binding protein [Stellaceae bacterium]|jgi:putrescine transport system substrate-binding protein|nr:polyamine ABC transporter substrate-binding protein [Stellaceae bacterium]
MRILLSAASFAVVAAAVSLPGVAAEEKVLNIYNWSDYIAPETVSKFEAETGIKVNYDVYDSNEVLEAKLLAGKSGYDLVVPSASPFLARQIKAKVYRKLDKAKLKNYDNLDKQILTNQAVADPDNLYGVPYLWGTTGFGYNAAKIKAALGDDAPLDSMAMIFDPAIAKKLAPCGISLLDSALDVFPAVLAYIGRDPTSKAPADLEAAVAVVSKIRPYVKKFHSSQYINDLANGDLCISLGYSGDIVQARTRAAEAKNGIEIAYTIPKEGAQLSTDMMAIPASAKHPDNAHLFIDFILRPEVVAAITNAVGYPNPNALATDMVDEDIRNDPSVYPPDAVRAKFFVDKPASAEYERARTRAWTKLKSGS